MPKLQNRLMPNALQITKTDLESVFQGLKLPVFVLSGRYLEISGFSFTADRHFYLSPVHFRLLPTQHCAKMASTARHIGTDNLSLREPSHLERKC